MFERAIRPVKEIISDIGRQVNECIEELGRSRALQPRPMPSLSRGVKLDSSIVRGLGRFLRPEAFSSGRLVLLVFLLYILASILSSVPILYPVYWVTAALLVFIGIFALWAGGKLCRIKSMLDYRPNYNLWAGIFLIGIIGLVINYATVGIPLFNAVAKTYYHNMTWSVSMMFYLVGMTATLARHRNATSFILLALVSVVLAVPSGFVTDLVLFLFPILFFAYFTRGLRKSHVIEVIIICLILIVGIKYLLMFFGGPGLGVEDLILSRPAFTLYVLSIMLMNIPLLGLTFGAMYSNIFVQLLGVPRALMGAVVGEMIVNMPRFYASTLVGPFYLEFGIIGVIIGCLFLGFFAEIPHRIYRLTRNHFFLGLYCIQLSIILVWIETGVIQYYLAFLFFAIGLWCWHRSRKR
jgi:hypothetical protein